MTAGCISCTIRRKIQAGCCVQGNWPDEKKGKTIRNLITGKKIQACESFNPQTGECLDGIARPGDCRGFNCERSYRGGWL